MNHQKLIKKSFQISSIKISWKPTAEWQKNSRGRRKEESSDNEPPERQDPPSRLCGAV